MSCGLQIKLPFTLTKFSIYSFFHLSPLQIDYLIFVKSFFIKIPISNFKIGINLYYFVFYSQKLYLISNSFDTIVEIIP